LDNNTLAKKITYGAWIPKEFHLERIQDPAQTYKSIIAFQQKGFSEYYFVMRNFNNVSEVGATERLLNAADKAGLRVFIILLPPSESGNYGAYSTANYNWYGWINYFNSIKQKYPTSFAGFVMDDFNAYDSVRRLYARNNINYFTAAGLLAALSNKRIDIQFFPVMYLETAGFDTLKKNYGGFLTGVILAKVQLNDYSTKELGNITQIQMLSNMFKDKPLKYIVYTSDSGNLSAVSGLFNYVIRYVQID
jgi:hypothetical protein